MENKHKPGFGVSGSVKGGVYFLCTHIIFFKKASFCFCHVGNLYVNQNMAVAKYRDPRQFPSARLHAKLQDLFLHVHVEINKVKNNTHATQIVQNYLSNINTLNTF